MYRVILDNSTIPVRSEKVYNLWQASKVVRDYIERFGLGASNFFGGDIIDTKEDKRIARISYNGRIWDNDNNELKGYYPREVRNYIKERYNFD